MSVSEKQRLEDSMTALFARVCQIYGIPPSLGRLYTLLYLSFEPMSLSELTAAAGSAKSTTSVGLRRLEQYRFVRRLPRGADRRDYYEAVTDPMTLIQDWVRHFIRPELEVSEEMLVTFAQGVSAAEAAGEYAPAQAEELRRRGRQMRDAIDSGRALIEMLSTPENPH